MKQLINNKIKIFPYVKIRYFQLYHYFQFPEGVK